jgi:asparagine synthetase B (glutamine-hydrolysing)
LFSYSQDTAVNWVHPFADWDFVEYITNIHPKYKLNKLAFREAMADIISLIPWNYPKNGLSIPAISKY